jgi:hypothetical protein
MSEHRADYPIRTLCRVLGVSPSGYYAWRDRPPSVREVKNRHLRERMREIHAFSRQTYGRPRMYAELRDEGWRVNHKRVARLMALDGLQGASRRKKWRTTKRGKDARPAPDLVDRDFAAGRPDQLWVADITYVPTWSGFLYLAVVVDAYSRRVVGWSMESHLKTELVLQALNMALWQRNPESVIHHSDQGTQARLNRSSQHLEGGSCNGDWKETSFGWSGAREDALSRPAFGGTKCRAAAVLESDRGRTFQRGRRGGGRSVARRGHTLVPGGRGDAATAPYDVFITAVGTIPVLCGTRRNRDLPCAGS